MSKTITLTVGRDGKVRSEAHGFRGVGCEDVIKKLTAGLSTEVASSEHKAEYYLAEETRESLAQGEGGNS